MCVFQKVKVHMKSSPKIIIQYNVTMSIGSTGFNVSASSSSTHHLHHLTTETVVR